MTINVNYNDQGQRHGYGEQIYSNGDKFVCNYENGLKQGPAIFQKINGVIQYLFYVNGLRHGKAVTFYPDGLQHRFTYFNGVPEGKMTFLKSNGVTIKCLFLNGNKNGPAKTFYPNGDVVVYTFQDGLMEGNAFLKTSYGIYRTQFIKNVPQQDWIPLEGDFIEMNDQTTLNNSIQCLCD